MFYVRVKRPIDLRREAHKPYDDINKKYGIKYGIFLVKDGTIEGEKGKAPYFDYIDIMKVLPTFRCSNWNDLSPIEKVGDKKFITVDLRLESGLMLQRGITLELHDINYLSDEEDGVYLLLCSFNDYYLQIITD